MKILNLSEQVQELSVVDCGNRTQSYSIFVAAGKSIEIDSQLIVTNLASMEKRGLLKVVGSTPIKETKETPVQEDTPEIVEETPETVEETPETVEETPETVEETPTVDMNTPESDEFRCPDCDKVFASARSLNMHINKAHKE